MDIDDAGWGGCGDGAILTAGQEQLEAPLGRNRRLKLDNYLICNPSK